MHGQWAPCQTDWKRPIRLGFFWGGGGWGGGVPLDWFSFFFGNLYKQFIGDAFSKHESLFLLKSTTDSVLYTRHNYDIVYAFIMIFEKVGGTGVPWQGSGSGGGGTRDPEPPPPKKRLYLGQNLVQMYKLINQYI